MIKTHFFHQTEMSNFFLTLPIPKLDLIGTKLESKDLIFSGDIPVGNQ